MFKKKLFVRHWTQEEIDEMGEEMYQQVALVSAARVLGIYIISKTTQFGQTDPVYFDSIELEDPCEEHPGVIAEFVHLEEEENCDA